VLRLLRAGSSTRAVTCVIGNGFVVVDPQALFAEIFDEWRRPGLRSATGDRQRQAHLLPYHKELELLSEDGAGERKIRDGPRAGITARPTKTRSRGAA